MLTLASKEVIQIETKVSGYGKQVVISKPMFLHFFGKDKNSNSMPA